MSFKATLNYKMSVYSIIFIALSALALIYFKWVSSPQPLHVIAGDGEDYYSYLVSVFIKHDMRVDPSQWYAVSTPGGAINLHTVGVALMELPFFLAGLFWANLTHAELTGFSQPFQVMIQVAAWVYLIVGLFYTARFLADRGFSDQIIALVLAVVFFGTTLINYAIHEPSMSHIYSFALISAFLFYAGRLVQECTAGRLYRMAFLLGLIILVRPVNGLVLLALPCLASSSEQLRAFMQGLWVQRKHVFAAMVICISVLAVQSVIWFFQNGHLLQWSYKGNGFYFATPHTLSMLFGFNGGLFIYTPLCFFALAGFWFMFRKSRFSAWALILFSAVITYVFSAYWGWTYFDGIGIRAYVDYFTLLALLLALLFSSLKTWQGRSVSTLVFGISLFLNLVFCYQYYAGILPGAGMTRDKFAYIFLRTSDACKNTLGGCNDLQPYSEQQPPVPVYSYHETFENNSAARLVHRDGNAFYLFNGNEYGFTYTSPALGFRSNKIHVKVDLNRLEFRNHDSDGALLAISLDAADGTKKLFQTFRLNDVPSEGCAEWKACHYGITACAMFEPDDTFSVFIWNKAGGRFGIDDFKLELYNHNYLN
ncbi:MAG: ammonium transporter [Bacteroidetes bacterium]|nr:ammonium transporter [Bacteroidota bacterium]